MLPTTILINETPKFVVRPADLKALIRFLRNGKDFLLAENPDGRISHRPADEAEAAKWRKAMGLHSAWCGSDEDFFGVPL